jgi:hypothetical protein
LRGQRQKASSGTTGEVYHSPGRIAAGERHTWRAL